MLQQVLLAGSFYFYYNASFTAGCLRIQLREIRVGLWTGIVHPKGCSSRLYAVVLWRSKMRFKNIAVSGNRQKRENPATVVVQHNNLQGDTQRIEQ